MTAVDDEAQAGAERRLDDGWDFAVGMAAADVGAHARIESPGGLVVFRLLTGREESHVLLSTPEANGEANRAWRLYRRLGFTDVIRGYHFAGDPRAFAILGRSLPL